MQYFPVHLVDYTQLVFIWPLGGKPKSRSLDKVCIALARSSEALEMSRAVVIIMVVIGPAVLCE